MNRDKKVDIAKAIGIILVVWGHSGAPFSSFIFRFHMALFFVLSGWCFKDKHIKNSKDFFSWIISKIKGLYIPFVIFNASSVLFRNQLIDYNILTDNELFLETPLLGNGNMYGIMNKLNTNESIAYLINILKFNGEQQLGGATWFLRVLFWLSITWGAIQFILKSVAKFEDKHRFVFNVIISVALLAIAFNWNNNNIHFITQFETVASSYWLFSLGYYLKKIHVDFTPIQDFIIVLFSFSILRYCDKYCSLMGWNSNVNLFDNPFMFIITSIAGFILIMALSAIISKLNRTNLLEFIGKHTLGIMIWHFLAYKIITLLQLYVYKEPLYRLASFPIYYSGNYWWVAYCVIGIAIPLLLIYIYNIVKSTNPLRKLYQIQK